ncbi:MAG: hypothetical protein ACR2I0_05490, partial [Rhodoferax sp.]
SWTAAADAQWSNAVVTTGLQVTIQDLNNNSVPTGSTIDVAVTDNSTKLPSDGAATPAFGTCTKTGQSYVAVPNLLGPLTLDIFLKTCVSGDQVLITVTTPAGVKAVNFSVP